MIPENSKIYNLRNSNIVLSESAEKIGLENDMYLHILEDRTIEFILYPENPLPARICIEDLSRRFFTCIGLFEPVYYFHDIYQGVFTKEQKEKLNGYLHGKDKYGNVYNRWRYLVDAWEVAMGENDIMNKIKIPTYSKDMPDYTLLPDIEPDHPAMFNLQIKYK